MATAISAPSNRLSEYTVDVTISSDLGEINYRILITRFTPTQPPFPFEMLLTYEQYVVFQQIFNPV
jgi:hypothetical protein